MKFATLIHLFLVGSNALLIPNSGRAVTSEKRSKLTGAQVVAANPNGISTLKAREDLSSHQYIVVLKTGHDESEYEAHDEWVSEQFVSLKKRGDIEDVSEISFFNVSSFKGYSGSLTPDLLQTIQEDPIVAFVEEDQIFEEYAVTTQNNAPWGLARVSAREKSSPASTDYIYDDQGGNGVTAYIVDSGIKASHPDFEGRASWGLAIATPGTEADTTGHGSHVAGTIGGKTYGVAKKVDLVAVGVLNSKGKGYTSDIIKGIEFAVNDHQGKVSSKKSGYKGATINLSLGGGTSSALDRAVNAAVTAGLHVVVAAGNSNQDACLSSPARASGPITVGATDINDKRASFSNYGMCVDVQAPGVSILSVGISSDTAVKSGTSMASPHVAGLLSYFLSLQPGLGSEFSAEALVTPAQLKRKFLRFGTVDVITGLDSASPNILAFNGAGEDLAELWSY